MKIRTVEAFTIVELTVSIAILSLLVVFISRLFTSAASVTTTGNRHMDCDLQARQVFDRMAVDFAQMIKRSDVDQYVKGLDPMKPGNDRIAFFSQVPGYSPTSATPSPISLVAYRINADNTSLSFNKMERMGKGLLWNGVLPTPTPPNDKSFVFGPSPTLQTNWPGATTGDPSNASYKDPDYELVGPQVFRFEYYYILNDGTLADNPGATGIPNVTAIAVCIAVVDPKSKILISNDQLGALAAAMPDFDMITMKPGDLIYQWQAALNASTLPRAAVSAIRVYERYFYLFPKR